MYVRLVGGGSNKLFVVVVVYKNRYNVFNSSRKKQAEKNMGPISKRRKPKGVVHLGVALRSVLVRGEIGP